MTDVYELTFRDDSGVTTLIDDDLDYLKAELRRREGMGMAGNIKKVRP